MKNQLKKVLLAAAFLFGLAGSAFGQASLTQTTLAAAVNGPALYSGTSATIDGCWTLASVTNVSAPTLPGTPVSLLYAAREVLGVLTVNTSTKIVCGIRGYMGTQASPHTSGAMVLVSLPVNTANGGNPNSSGFLQFDMPAGGACTAANTPATPMLNVINGAQWLCSTVTNTWVPGWQNPYSGDQGTVTATVASVAGTTVPSGPIFQITGTNAIVNFGIPVGFDPQGGGCFFAIPSSGIWTWTAAGNIATAGTVTAANNVPVIFCWNAGTQKWVPSRIT